MKTKTNLNLQKIMSSKNKKKIIKTQKQGYFLLNMEWL